MLFCRLALLFLSGLAWSVGAAEPNEAIVLQADARASAQPLRHFWSAAVEGGTVSQALRATWQEHWRVAAAECGFKSVVLRGLFGPNEDRVDFSSLDDLFDRLVAANTHPFLRLDLPTAARGTGRTGPFVARFVQHYADRYGSPELRQWSFALVQPASGDYAALYRSAAAAIKAIDPQLRVGGPLEALTGTTGAPVDFVTARSIPAAGLPVAARVFPRAELALIDGTAELAASDFTWDSLPAAAWIIRQTLELGGRVDALSYGAFSDQAEAPGMAAGIFHGGPGLMSAQGVVKPAFHAYRYLNALGDEVLATAPGGIVSRRKNSGRVVLLAYNVPPEAGLAWPAAATLAAADQLAARGSSRTVSINLSGLRPGGQILIEMLELNHGNASEAWQRMGAPAEPTRPALAALQSGAREMRLEYRQADELGRFAVSQPLAPWAVLLLREL